MMRRILLTLFGIVIVLGLFAAVGYAGYRVGYAQGLQSTASGAPQLHPFDDFGRDEMPRHGFGFERGFRRGFDGFPGRGFAAPFLWLIPLAVLGLGIGLVYWLVTRSGWRLTREPAGSTPVVNPPAETSPSPPGSDEEPAP